MPKKKDQMSDLNTPDYESLHTLEAVDAEVERHKQILVGKDILEAKMKKDKKEYVSSLNEQLKELAEEREHEIDVLSALEQRKQMIENSGKLPRPPRVPNLQTC